MKKAIFLIGFLAFGFTSFSQDWIANGEAMSTVRAKLNLLKKEALDSAGFKSDLAGVTSLNNPTDSVGIGTTAPIERMDIRGNMRVGSGAAGNDPYIRFTGEASTGTITYMEDEDRIDFDGDVMVNGSITSTGSGSLHAGMFFNVNTTAQTPIAGDTTGMIYFSFADTTGFAYTAGLTGSYTAATGNKAAHVGLFITGTSFVAGNWLLAQDETGTSYSGVHEVTSVSSDTVYFLGTFVATGTGKYQRPSTLTLVQTGISSQTFNIEWNISTSCAGSPAGDIVDYGVFVNRTKYVRTMSRMTVSTGSIWESICGGGLLSLTTGDDIFMFFVSNDLNALTNRFGSIRVKQE